MNEFEAFDTLAVHAGEDADPETGALRQPLHMSTTFKLPGFGIKLFDAIYMDSSRPPYAYTRWCNPTLRALEEALLNFPGTVLVISHDRWFLDRIATHILAFEGDSHVEWFAGNFSDYEIDHKKRLAESGASNEPTRVHYKPLSRS